MLITPPPALLPEIKATLSMLADGRVAPLLPMYLYSNWFFGYQFGVFNAGAMTSTSSCPVSPRSLPPPGAPARDPECPRSIFRVDRRAIGGVVLNLGGFRPLQRPDTGLEHRVLLGGRDGGGDGDRAVPGQRPLRRAEGPGAGGILDSGLIWTAVCSRMRAMWPPVSEARALLLDSHNCVWQYRV